MEIYIFFFLIVVFFAAFDIYFNISNDIKSLFLFSTYIVVVLIIGLRWETGTDWIAYFDHFQKITTWESTSPLLTGMEYGYSVFILLLKYILSDYSFILIIHSLIYYYLIFKGINILTPYFFLAILLFLSFTMGVVGSHRQLLSLGIILFSTKYILQRKFFHFLMATVLASLFHTTAIICIALYFFNRNLSTMFLISLIIVSIILGYTPLPAKAFNLLSNIGGIGDKVLFYLEGGKENAANYGVTIIGLVKRVLFVALFLISKKFFDHDEKYNFMLNSYVIGIVVYFMFSSSLTVLVSRGSLYFNMFEPILLSCQLLLFKSKKERILILFILLIFTVFYFRQSIAEYPDLFLPYKGLFINSDYNRNLH